MYYPYIHTLQKETIKYSDTVTESIFIIQEETCNKKRKETQRKQEKEVKI